MSPQKQIIPQVKRTIPPPPPEDELTKWWNIFVRSQAVPFVSTPQQVLGAFGEVQKTAGGLISQPFVPELGGMGKTTLSPSKFLPGGEGQKVYEKVVPSPARFVAEEAIAAPLYLVGGAKGIEKGGTRLAELITGRAANAETKIAAKQALTKAERFSKDIMDKLTEFGKKPLSEVKTEDILKEAYGTVKLGTKETLKQIAIEEAGKIKIPMGKAAIQIPRLAAKEWQVLPLEQKVDLVKKLGLNEDAAQSSWSAMKGSWQKGLSRLYAGDKPSVVKLSRLIADEVKPFQAEASEAYKASLKPKVARYYAAKEAAKAQGKSAEEAMLAGEKQFAGKLKELPDDVLGKHITDSERAELMQIIDAAKLRPFDETNIRHALTDMLEQNKLPEPAELILMEQVFGVDFVKSILSNRSLSQKVLDVAFDIANLPRALKASFDLSAVLRQGLVLLPGHPKASYRSFKWMLKALKSEKAATEMNNILLGKGDLDVGIKAAAARRLDAGLFLHETGSSLVAREEAFISKLSKRIPGINISERTYTTYLNKVRCDVFDSIVAGWEKSGKKITELDEKELARFINRATGRGELWFGEYKTGARKLATPYGGLANLMFFSPRLQTSRLLLPLSLFSKSPAVRKVAARDLGAFVGTATGILALLAQHPDIEVETDYRSTDAGKIKIGKTHIDLSAGFNPFIRMFWRISTGEKLSLAGRPIPKRPISTIIETIRQKLSPVAGEVWNVAAQETYAGEPLWFQTGEMQDFINQAIDAFAPMISQTIKDAVKEGELIPGTAGTALEFFGAGTTIYDSAPSLVTDVYSLEGYYQNLQKSIRDLIKDGKIGAAKKIIKDNPDAKIYLNSQDGIIYSGTLQSLHKVTNIIDKTKKQIEKIEKSKLSEAEKKEQTDEIERKLITYCSDMLLRLEFK